MCKHIINTSEPIINPEMLKQYEYWIKERYKIRYKKDVLKENAPWTSDEIFGSVKFTNVFREDDRATRWLIDNVCSNIDLSLETRIANCILFRLYNKWETCEKMGVPLSTDVMVRDNKELRAFFTNLEKNDPDYTIFTSAFNTGGMKAAVGRLTGEEYIPMRPIAFMEHMIRDGVLDKIMSAENAHEVFLMLVAYSGIGEFLAYQMFVDFTYCEDFMFSENEYTVAGPGCKMGIDFLFDDKAGMTYEECIFWIRDNQRKLLDIDFDDLFKDREECDRCLNVMCIENSFCEFSKFVRCLQQVEEGKKPRARVKYQAGTTQETTSTAKSLFE